MARISCPYCGQGGITVEEHKSAITDLMARGIGLLRLYFEMADDAEFGWLDLVEAFRSGQGIPVATDSDRQCPYCRRGVVTRRSTQSLYLDTVMRATGWMRLLKQRDFTWSELARIFVEGEQSVDEEPEVVVEVVDDDDAEDPLGDFFAGG